MIVGLKFIHTSPEHYNTGISSNVYSSFWHISHFSRTIDFEPVHLADSERHRIYSDMNISNRWWERQDQLPPGATIVTVIRVSDKTHLTDFPGIQHAWPLDFTIGNSRTDISRTPEKCSWILVVLIPGPPESAKNTDEALHSAVGKVLSALRNLDIFGTGLTWDSADGFQRQCDPILAAWVGDYPGQLMVAQVSDGSCPMCEIPKGVPLGHSTFRPLDNPPDQHVYLDLLDKTNIDVLHTLWVHPIRNQFWQYPLCNVYRLWQPDEMHQLLLGLVEGLLHWLLKYLKARDVKDHFDNRFTSVPRYPGLQRLSKPFDSMKRGSCQGKEIWGMIRTLAVHCAPIHDRSQNAGKSAAETAYDEMVMGAVRALCEFSPRVSQQNHSDLSLAALDDTLKGVHKKKGGFREQTISMSAKATVAEPLARESDHLRVQIIHKIRAAMELQLYGAENVSTSDGWQRLERLNRARQGATIWS